MKVLYIVGGDGKGYGSERVATDIIGGLTAEGVEYIVITSHYGYVNEFCNEFNIENYVVDSYLYMYRDSRIKVFEWLKRYVQIIYGFLKDYIAMKKICKVIDIHSIDVIHTNLSRTLLGGIISNKYKIPHVWHIHELFTGHYDVHHLLPKHAKWISDHSEKVIAVSDAVKRSWLRYGLKDEKTIKIYNGIDTSSIKKKDFSKKSKMLKLVMVGSISVQKGQYIVLQAIANLCEKDREKVEVDFYGECDDGSISELEKFSKTNNIAVRFKGYSANVRNELYKYDVGLNCSMGEAFGMSTLEYMATGLVAIACDSGGTVELINDGIDGFLFHRDNVVELSNILKKMIDKEIDFSKIGKRAVKSVNEKFEVVIQCKRILETYSSVIN